MKKVQFKNQPSICYSLWLFLVWGMLSCQEVEEVIPSQKVGKEYLMDTRVARAEVGCPANLPALWPGAQMGRDYGCYWVKGTKGQQLMANKA